jgi:hypothetical protein
MILLLTIGLQPTQGLESFRLLTWSKKLFYSGLVRQAEAELAEIRFPCRKAMSARSYF